MANLVRTYGRSGCGYRCVGSAPQALEDITAVAGVRLGNGLVDASSVDAGALRYFFLDQRSGSQHSDLRHRRGGDSELFTFGDNGTYTV